ncbi:MAG: putative N-acetyl-alpha-D-glucosaminyl L-malate deacetylase 2 [Syntrophomonadaceae bacterium]|nr:putative N-acetyl-alpha-D-glucosaminyl L-malate deacetylase 2 [Bacillota bacterium]
MSAMMGPAKAPRAVIFSPHPDDDILACGGTIGLRVSQGYRVYVIYMTDGRNSHLHELGIARNPSPSQLAVIRKEEAKKALSILGIDKSCLGFLDFEDGSLEADLNVAKDKVQRILRDIQPQEVCFPMSTDEHRDHRATSIIVSESLKEVCFQGLAYRYTIWGNQNELASPDEQKSIDISHVLALKRKAILEHQSQVTRLFLGQERPILDDFFISKFLGNAEIFNVWKPK